MAAAIMIGHGGSDSPHRGARQPHKVLPGNEQGPGSTRRPGKPRRARSLWSIFEDHTELIRSTPDRRRRALEEIRALGADTLRVEVKWNEIAPSPNRPRRPSFNASDPAAYPGFAPYDDVFERAHAMGLRVLADLAPDAPQWATAGARGFGANANLRPLPADFGKFAAAVAKRYSGSYRGLPRVEWFSIWNEPNHSLFLKPLDEAPGIYRGMVEAALPAIRANAAAGARVLVGETAPSGRPGRSTGPREFMQRWLCLDSAWRPVSSGPCRGARRLGVDGFAHHPYGPLDAVPSDRDIVSMLVIRRLGDYLDRAAAAGRLPRHLPIYDTEFGLQSNPPDPTVHTSVWEQAAQLNEKEQLSYRYPRLRSYAQYLLYDDPIRPGPRDVAWSGFQTGLRLDNGTLKPAWSAYRLPITVHRTGNGVRIWGHARPGHGRRTVQLQRLRGGAWRNAGAPLKTDSEGFFDVRRRSADAYRFIVPGVGSSRVATP